MSTIHGIVPTQFGRYVIASLRKTENVITGVTVKSWNCDNKLRRFLLLHKGVYCGVPSFWKSAKSILPAEVFCNETPDNPFTIATDRIHADIHINALSQNLLGVVPDDAFLNTIPLYLNSKPEDSFIAIYSNEEYCKIGIVTNRKIHAVFRFTRCKISHIEFYIARIERYFKATCPHIHFPSHCFLIGADTGMVFDKFSLTPLPVIIGKKNIKDEDELKAIGVAFVKENGEVPLFTGATLQSSFRNVRAGSYIGSLSVVGAAILALVFIYAANIITSKNLGSYESQYNSMFSNNVSIKSIVARNESLAKAILSLEQEMSAYTNWTQLLNVLGTEKTDDILFDKLGSEPVADKKISAVRIAITGCARNEVAVTGLISRLQKISFLSKVTLASLAKSEKNANTNDFKILCTMNVKK